MADFSTGLCSCCTDCGSCCYGWICGCCLFSDNWKKIRGTANPCCMCFCPMSMFWVRQTLRMRKHMSRNDCGDCMTSCLCWNLANCQHARELNNGFCLPNGTEYYSGEMPPKPQGYAGPPPQGYAGPPPQGYAGPPPQGYPPQQGYAAPPPQGYSQPNELNKSLN